MPKISATFFGPPNFSMIDFAGSIAPTFGKSETNVKPCEKNFSDNRNGARERKKDMSRSMDQQELINWVREGLTASGKSNIGLARALGRQPSAVTAILNGSRQIKAFEISVIANYLGVPAPGEPAREATDAILDRIRDLAPGSRPAPEFLSGADPLPVFSAVEGGPGEIVVSRDAIDYVPRPWFVKNVREAYAVLVVGESMLPAFKPGQMAFVNPRVPLVAGEEAIFIRNRDDGDYRATIKELIKATPAHWRVRQWNPPKEFDLDRAEWAQAYRVVGKFNRG